MKPELDTKHKLLQTALDLIWESSYGSISVDDICKRAGVQKGSFYHFFPSKSDLAVAAFDEYWEKSRRPQLDRDFSPQLSPEERFTAYCDQVYKTQKERAAKTGKVCGCPFSSIGSEMCNQDNNVREKARSMGARIRTYYESALRDMQREGRLKGVNVSAKALELYSFTTGMLLQARIQNNLEMIRDLKSTFWRLLDLREKIAA